MLSRIRSVRMAAAARVIQASWPQTASPGEDRVPPGLLGGHGKVDELVHGGQADDDTRSVVGRLPAAGRRAAVGSPVMSALSYPPPTTGSGTTPRPPPGQSGRSGISSPAPLFTRVPRVNAPAPYFPRTASQARSSRSSPWRSKENDNCSASSASNPLTRDPDQVEPVVADQRHRRGDQRAGRLQHRVGGRRPAGQGVRTGHPGEVAEPQPQGHRSARPLRRPQPPRDPVHAAHQHGVDLGRVAGQVAQGVLGADRSPPGPDHDRPGVVVVGQRVQVPAGGLTG